MPIASSPVPLFSRAGRRAAKKKEGPGIHCLRMCWIFMEFHDSKLHRTFQDIFVMINGRGKL